MTIFFARHGETNYNTLGLCNDDPKQDVHLTDLGKQQAMMLAQELKTELLSIIYISELPRTRQTAEIINQFHNVPIIVDWRINDRKTGFEGKPVSSFLSAIATDMFNIKLNGGESFQEEKDRILSFLKNLPTKHSEENILVVTHSETMKIINGYYKNLSNEETWKIRFGNTDTLKIEV